MSVGSTREDSEPARAGCAAGIAPHPPYHRAGRRRPELSHPHRPLALVITLHLFIVGVLLLGVCTAMPAGVALLALEAQGWMSENTIDLPREGRLDRDLPQTARIASRDGTLLAEIDDVRYGRRTFVPISEMARDLVTATMATEDRRYYTHPGVDPVGLVRALGTNAESGSASQGGSTIEMQLTRNLFLADERTERTLGRKVKEALAAVELDKRYSKDELLETYLNVVFYGNRAFGAEAASHAYFGKSARDLTLPPPQVSVNFDFVPLKLDAAGNRRFLVRMRLGGSPSLVALEKLTPLFNVDGKGPVEYVTDAFFAANPHRTPRSIQPEDEFVLSVPADTFIVRWQEEQEEHLFGPVRLRAYVSDRGDRLRIYLTDRYPILYELESVDKPGSALSGSTLTWRTCSGPVGSIQSGWPSTSTG